MNPYPTPENQAPRLTGAELDQLREIASYQRFINLAILANIIGLIAFKVMPPSLQMVANLVLLVLGIASAIASVLLAKTLHGIAVAVVCAVLAFVPCVNLLTLLVLNQSATSRIQKAGFKVGLLGANPADIR